MPVVDGSAVGDPKSGTVASARALMQAQDLSLSQAAECAAGAPVEFYDRMVRAVRPSRWTSASGEVNDRAAGSLRPTIVKVLAENRERPLKTQEIYDLVAGKGVPGFDPRAKRDRNLVNRELSNLAGMSPESHSKSTPQLLNRVGRGRYIYREPDLPLDIALVREFLEPTEVYEKRPQRRSSSGPGRERVSDSVG